MHQAHGEVEKVINMHVEDEHMTSPIYIYICTYIFTISYHRMKQNYGSGVLIRKGLSIMISYPI